MERNFNANWPHIVSISSLNASPTLQPKVSTICALSTIWLGLVIDNDEPTDGIIYMLSANAGFFLDCSRGVFYYFLLKLALP